MAPVESEVVAVTHLFPPERASLVKLLGSLDAEQWRAPTVCPGWSVKDVALHLLGDDVGLLSRRRDGVLPAGMPAEPAGWEELVASLDRLNQTWVAATRLISPRLLCELLTFTARRPGATWPAGTRSRPRPRSPGSGPTRPRTGWTWPASTASAGPTSSRSATRWGSPG